MTKGKEKEKDFYQLVEEWLYAYLSSKLRRYEILVKDTHRVKLCDFLRREGLLRFFPEGETYEIMPDITGVARKQDKCLLIIVECKMGIVNLRDIAQILGYSIICKPEMSFIISSKGISDSFKRLVREYERIEILEYMSNHYIQVLKYDTLAKGIDYSQSIIVP